MRIERNLLPGIFIGIIIGILLTSIVIHLADTRVCPECYTNFEDACIDEANIIPISDREYFPIVHRALKEAVKSIYIVAFELKYYNKYPKSMENILIDDIIDAKERGLDVKIIVDDYSRKNNAFDILKGKGIDIKYDSKDVTTHAKLIIIDGKIVILGSTNFSYYGLEKNNEVDVLIESTKIADYFERYFDGLWSSL